MAAGVKIELKGNFNNTNRFLQGLTKAVDIHKLRAYAEQGLDALKSATPIDSGKTAESWYYTIKRDGNGYTISYNNTNINNGVPIAIILQYGHGTGTGGYVKGRDYINPAIQPIFDDIVDSAWKEVQKL